MSNVWTVVSGFVSCSFFNIFLNERIEAEKMVKDRKRRRRDVSTEAGGVTSGRPC